MTTRNQLQSANSKNDRLIVDFPVCGRNKIDSDDFPSTTYYTYPTEQIVWFNPTCTIHKYVPKSSQQDKKIIWSSSNDRKLARQTQRLEAIQMRNILDSIEEGTIISDDELILCIGIENLLSDKLIRRTLEQRKRHVSDILSEQQRQRDLGISDDEALRRVSEMCSQKSRFRAFKLADGYSKIH